MKKDILFRGKRIDNGEWVEGYPLMWETPIIMNRHKIEGIDDFLYSYDEVEPDSICQVNEYLPDQEELKWIIIRIDKDSPEEIVRMLRLYLEKNKIKPIKND